MREVFLAKLSRPLAGGLFALVLTAGGIAHSEGQSVSIEPSRSMYGVGEKAEFTITNGTQGPIFISGCGALQVQHFESETYVPDPGETCVSEGPSVEIAPGTHTLSLDTAGQKTGQILRVGLSYGWACEAGRELSQSRCADFSTVYSKSFRIVRPGDK